MNIGDVVLYQESRWKVLAFVPGLRVYVLANAQGKIEAPDDAEALEDLRVLFNPGQDWPFVVVPILSKGGPIVKILRGETELEFMVDWVPSDFVRSGGSIFFSPGLHLRQGEVLSGIHQLGGLRSRIAVLPSFGSIKARRRRSQQSRKMLAPKTTLDRLIDTSPFDDEND